ERPPNHYEVLSERQQLALDSVVDANSGIALRAFDYWLRVMRWKVNDGSIGRPRYEGPETGWGTYLVDEETAHRIWVTGAGAHLLLKPGVGALEWARVQ